MSNNPYVSRDQLKSAKHKSDSRYGYRTGSASSSPATGTLDHGIEVIVTKASRSSTVEPLAQQSTPGPAKFTCQDSLTVPAGTRLNPLEPASRPERKTVLYRASPSCRVGSGDDITSARLNQAEEFQLAVPGWSNPNIIRLQSVDPNCSNVDRDCDNRVSISVDVKVLHPDCLLVVENRGVSMVMVIDKGENHECFTRVNFVQGVDPEYRFADFLHEMCINVGGYASLNTLSSGNFHEKYKLVMLANCEVFEEVVTESNWSVLLQDKGKGARWRFDLYLIEVYPADESSK